jgi:hypothetical protein
LLILTGYDYSPFFYLHLKTNNYYNTLTMGKFAPITSMVVQFFLQIDLGWLASGDLELTELYMSDDQEQLGLDPMSIICSGT